MTARALTGSVIAMTAAILGGVGLLAAPGEAHAVSETTLEKVVSVLPVRAGRAPDGAAPEGSGVVVAPGGLIATAAHVIDKAARRRQAAWGGAVSPSSMASSSRWRSPGRAVRREKAHRAAEEIADRRCEEAMLPVGEAVDEDDGEGRGHNRSKAKPASSCQTWR